MNNLLSCGSLRSPVSQRVNLQSSLYQEIHLYMIYLYLYFQSDFTTEISRKQQCMLILKQNRILTLQVYFSSLKLNNSIAENLVLQSYCKESGIGSLGFFYSPRCFPQIKFPPIYSGKKLLSTDQKLLFKAFIGSQIQFI